MVSYRQFHKRDARKMQRIAVNLPAYGMTAEDDGRIVAYGGIHEQDDGRWWGFLNVFDRRWRKPMLIHRFAIDILAAAKRAGITVYALCDERHPRAVIWLERLGFRALTEGEKDDEIRRLESIRAGVHRTYIHDRA